MFVAGGKIGERELIVIGLDFDNLDRLRAGKPARSDLAGMPLIVLHAGPTLRDVVGELVDAGIVPPVARERFADPQPGEAIVYRDGKVVTMPEEESRG